MKRKSVNSFLGHPAFINCKNYTGLSNGEIVHKMSIFSFSSIINITTFLYIPDDYLVWLLWLHCDRNSDTLIMSTNIGNFRETFLFYIQDSRFSPNLW